MRTWKPTWGVARVPNGSEIFRGVAQHLQDLHLQDFAWDVEIDDYSNGTEVDIPGAPEYAWARDQENILVAQEAVFDKVSWIWNISMCPRWTINFNRPTNILFLH
jgi:hypothetical protein